MKHVHLLSTRPLLAVSVSLVLFMIAWAIALRAIDTGSWWFYGLVFVLAFVIFRILAATIIRAKRSSK